MEHLFIPIENTEPFVVDYQVLVNEDEPSKSVFRFMISSKKLLELAVNAEKLHTDATYKCIWQGYPVLMVGTSDMNRKFHPIGIAVCTAESGADFEFVFNAINKGVQRVFNVGMNPKYLICDAGKGIRKGFNDVYGSNNTIIMCWAHMRRAVVKKLPSYIRDKKTQIEFLFDVDKLQICRSNASFDEAASLFVLKWSQINEEFITDYFIPEWLETNRYWYEGVAAYVPSHNNAQEATHKVIKDNHTIRERFDLGKFRAVLFDMVKQYSDEYANGIREYFVKPSIPLPIWTSAYHWARENVDDRSNKLHDRMHFEIPLNSTQFIEFDESLIWTSFDNFRKFYFRKCIVSFATPLNKTNWEKGTCDCSEFFKEYICKHIVGIALRLKLVEAPIEAKSIPIGQKRKRGRPAHAKAALVLQ